ncbi:RagB/SusD family nutrient uptake outer membrane protein [Mucilaginibacter daejeonensis]|uniref:RagB/SusD family nutrient uptake outer membrane protein n=1 Tax=Mucilaginibacter daejeonensis TaxID=398049 RepID=UPI001D17A642|nr:RagB/SusD family nutrient uptake outer membrane protein [Mucilaginibacter daejeonensis]UEG54809.1 RagB/SusD family nutrient uptake outer membrane protein [Mucilaginibacter daejeonensis]
MKAYKLFTAVLAMGLLTQVSCQKDYLDRTPGVTLPEDAVFASPVLASQYAINAYNFLVDDYVRFNDHRGTTSQASDEAVTGNLDPSVLYLNQGLFHDHSEKVASLNDIRDIWSREYNGINITNTMLSKMTTVPWTNADQAKRVEGEMHFLRAFFYFELIKRFGGVPIMDKAYGVNDDIDFPRASYTECVNFILADLAKAQEQLPRVEDLALSENGRATVGAVKALKARVLLYAASPLNNETNDVAKWAAAAAAAKEVMDMGSYMLQPTYKDILNVTSSTEYIMMKVRATRPNTEPKVIDFAQSPGSAGANGQMNPTQNHVDLYEMTNGRAITDPSSGYDPQKPYANRDPRMTWNVIYNDETYQSRKIEMWSQTNATTGAITYGRDYNANNIIYTATRYYCRKMWPEVYINKVAGATYINFLFFRYAEILLNYAEAQNEAVGPDASVYAAINQIRARGDVNMPALPSGLTQAQMRDRIRNERAVELAFEDHRWYDIMRWKKGVEIVAQPIYAMNVVKNANGSFTYTKVLMATNYQKVFKDFMHRYPIPRSEIYKSQGKLIQNPGW